MTFRFLLACSALANLVGCGSDSSSSSPSEPKLSKADQAIFDQIFAAPTAAEKQAVLDAFASADLSGLQAEVVTRDTITKGSAQFGVWIVSHVSEGFRHYGGIVYPLAATQDLPVMLYCHGGDNGIDFGDDLNLLVGTMPALAENFVIIAPSFRSEPLTYESTTYESEGAPSPWNGDVRDALRLISAVESLTVAGTAPSINANKVRAIGFSRGAGVALLASLYDSRIDRVAEYFGPTDFYGDFVQDVTISIMNGESIDLPGVSYLDSALVQKVKAGSISVDSMRQELLLRSAAQFPEELPPIRIQHGAIDTIVPVTQAYALQEALQDKAPLTWANSSMQIYDGAGHNPAMMISGLGKTVAFLQDGLVSVALAKSAPPSPESIEIWQQFDRPYFSK